MDTTRTIGQGIQLRETVAPQVRLYEAMLRLRSALMRWFACSPGGQSL